MEDNKNLTDDSAIPTTIESEANNDPVQLDNPEIKKVEEPEVSITEESKECVMMPELEVIPTEEAEKVEEPEKLEPEVEKTSEKVGKTSEEVEKTSEEVVKVNEPVPVENTTVAVNDSVQQVTVAEQSTPVSDQLILISDNLIESAVPAQESLVESTQDQIVPVSQESVMEGSQQQVIAVTDSVLNNDVVKLEDNGVDLDQQSVLSMKDSELKDLVMRELSEFLTDEPSQNVGSSLLEIKSDFIKEDVEKKIENLENTLGATGKSTVKEEKKSENDIADALSTLATAALNQAPPTNGTADNNSVVLKTTQPVVQQKQEGPAWCDVGVIKGTTCLVKQFYSTSITDEHENTNLDHLPDYTNKLKIDIQPGTAYKLRIAAINTCGRGEWSEISAFKTCLPGYPGAPSAIKITKAPDGASLTWEAPPTSSGKILEYSVCLAIKNPKEVPPQSVKPSTTNLNFVRVYCGPNNAAVVSHESLGAALIDRTNKPAIIFRIAAKNEKGYGPATQVRWLQDSNVPGSNKNSLKREKSVNLLTGVPKRPKI